MLVHDYRRRLPDRDARLRRTVIRDEGLRVAVMSSTGIATDFGVTMQVLPCLTVAKRSQLSIVLAGRGYFTVQAARGRDFTPQSASGCEFESGARTYLLGPGDVVASDQAQQEAEGYAGSPSEVLVLEWEPEHWFAPFPPGPARLWHLAPTDVDALRTLVRDVSRQPAWAWIRALRDRLRALGLRAGDTPPPPLSAPMLDCYAALGGALGQLDAQPTLTELASTLGLSERQAHRRVGHLFREYGLPFDGWRELIHESRLEWAVQALSVPGVTISEAARLSGYRSTIALHHALSLRGAPTPGVIARTLADRWR
jgi:AraC-like DNA-binding protein